MANEKTFWIGDDGDNKSVSINRKIYVRGDEIPANNVDQKILDDWHEKGLISRGEYAAPVVIKDTGAVQALEAEVRSLKNQVDSIPALQKKIKELEASQAKAKDGAKAKRVKELEAENEELKKDIAEKAALIDKQAADIEALTTPVEGD